MWVVMTLLAFPRRRLEIDMHQRAFHRHRPMTPRALHCPMRSFQRKLGAGMVEEMEIVPLLRGVTSLATCRSACGNPLHARTELAFVRIRMTRLASQVREVVGNCL